MDVQLLQPNPQLFYCFNPRCQIACRVYHDSESILQVHHSCSGWIISSSMISNSTKEKQKSSEEQTIQQEGDVVVVNNLDYINDPIKSLLVIQKIFSMKSKTVQDILHGENQEMNPLKVLQLNFSLVKDKIQMAISKAYQKIEARINSIEKRSSQTLKVIRQIVTIEDIQTASKQIRNSIHLLQYQNFAQNIGNLTFVNSYQALDQIQKTVQCVQKLSQAFWREEAQSIKRERFGMNKAFDKIKQFAEDNSTQLSNKIQALASMYGQMVPPIIVDNQRQITKLQCWICNQDIQGYGNNVKQRKGDALKNIFSHLLTQHLKEVGFKFFQKQLKFNAFQISIQEFMYELQTFPYKKFILVDSQNAPKSNHHVRFASQTDVYIVHVVSQLRQSIAKGKYILSHSKGKDSADILIIIMVTMICQSRCLFKKLNSSVKENSQEASKQEEDHDFQIVLVTRDHFGNVLQQNFKGIGVSIRIDKQ